VTGLLLVAHGSRSPESAAETSAMVPLVAAALPGVTVDVGFLELTDPPAGPVLDRLVAGACDPLVVLPLMLLGAGHAKSDVPALVLEARQRHPAADIRLGAPLGITHGLVSMLGDAVVARGGTGMPLLLVARGTSDPDANGDACKAARLVGEWTGAPFVHTAFTGVTGPRVAEGLDVFARVVERAGRWLAPGGWLELEIGDDQGDAAAALLEAAGFDEVGVHPDLAGRDRILEGRRP
jgi:sirohydrochlorin cobaltochelatase